MKNDFPSILWDKLESTVFDPKYVPQIDDAYLLIARYQNALSFLFDASQESFLYHPLHGVRQGDTGAAQQFSKSFDKAIRRWCSQNLTVLEKAYFSTRDPWTGSDITFKIGVLAHSTLFTFNVTRLLQVWYAREYVTYVYPKAAEHILQINNTS